MEAKTVNTGDYTFMDFKNRKNVKKIRMKENEFSVHIVEGKRYIMNINSKVAAELREAGMNKMRVKTTEDNRNLSLFFNKDEGMFVTLREKEKDTPRVANKDFVVFLQNHYKASRNRFKVVIGENISTDKDHFEFPIIKIVECK